MENRKKNALFGFVLIAFIAGAIILVKDFNSIRDNDNRQCTDTINSILRQKSTVINSLYHRLSVVRAENEDLRRTLADTRNDLEILTSKLAEHADVQVPSGAQASAGAK